jgi:hypothetical protein
MKRNCERLQKQNPQFEYYLFDDADCLEFIQIHFDEEVADAFERLVPGAYKADLWRYCVLYVHGGIYLDMKMRCVGDFRLIDREIIEILKTVRAPDPYLRGFIASLGYEAKGVPYNRDSRKFGSSKFSLYKIVRLGLSGLFNHSAFPAKFSGLVSILALSGTLFLIIYVFLSKILGSPVPSGWAFLSILVLLGIGINSFLLWIISYYIFMLYKIALGEPKILLSSELGVGGEKQKLLNKGL